MYFESREHLLRELDRLRRRGRVVEDVHHELVPLDPALSVDLRDGLHRGVALRAADEHVRPRERRDHRNVDVGCALVDGEARRDCDHHGRGGERDERSGAS